jgi:hypothetical protein
MVSAVESSSPQPHNQPVASSTKKTTRCALAIIRSVGLILSGVAILKWTAAATLLGTLATPVGWVLIGLGIVLGGIEIIVYIRNRSKATLASPASASAPTPAPASGSATAPASPAAATDPVTAAKAAPLKKPPFNHNQLNDLVRLFKNLQRFKNILKEIKQVESNIKKFQKNRSLKNQGTSGYKSLTKQIELETQRLDSLKNDPLIKALQLARSNPALFSKLLMRFILNEAELIAAVDSLDLVPWYLSELIDIVNFKDITITGIDDCRGLIKLTLDLLENLKLLKLISQDDARYFKTQLNDYDRELERLASIESEEKLLADQEKLEMTVQETCLLIHNHWDDHNLQELHRETIEAINDFCRSIAD